MAYASWLKVNPSSGNGNGTIQFSSDPYMGRVERTTQASVQAEGVDPQVVNITQTPHEEYVTIQETASIANTGGSLTITGTSNSSKLTFSLGTGTIEITLPENYNVNTDVQTANGAEIAEDPGASDEFDYSIELTIPANVNGEEITRELIVTANGEQTDTCVITQAASAATLTLSTNTVTLTAEGTPVEVQVYSNTDWTVI